MKQNTPSLGKVFTGEVNAWYGLSDQQAQSLASVWSELNTRHDEVIRRGPFQLSENLMNEVAIYKASSHLAFVEQKYVEHDRDPSVALVSSKMIRKVTPLKSKNDTTGTEKLKLRYGSMSYNLFGDHRGIIGLYVLDIVGGIMRKVRTTADVLSQREQCPRNIAFASWICILAITDERDTSRYRTLARDRFNFQAVAMVFMIGNDNSAPIEEVIPYCAIDTQLQLRLRHHYSLRGTYAGAPVFDCTLADHTESALRRYVTQAHQPLQAQPMNDADFESFTNDVSLTTKRPLPQAGEPQTANIRPPETQPSQQWPQVTINTTSDSRHKTPTTTILTPHPANPERQNTPQTTDDIPPYQPFPATSQQIPPTRNVVRQPTSPPSQTPISTQNAISQPANFARQDLTNSVPRHPASQDPMQNVPSQPTNFASQNLILTKHDPPQPANFASQNLISTEHDLSQPTNVASQNLMQSVHPASQSEQSISQFQWMPPTLDTQWSVSQQKLPQTPSDTFVNATEQKTVTKLAAPVYFEDEILINESDVPMPEENHNEKRRRSVENVHEGVRDAKRQRIETPEVVNDLIGRILSIDDRYIINSTYTTEDDEIISVDAHRMEVLHRNTTASTAVLYFVCEKLANKSLDITGHVVESIVSALQSGKFVYVATHAPFNYRVSTHCRETISRRFPALSQLCEYDLHDNVVSPLTALRLNQFENCLNILIKENVLVKRAERIGNYHSDLLSNYIEILERDTTEIKQSRVNLQVFNRLIFIWNSLEEQLQQTITDRFEVLRIIITEPIIGELFEPIVIALLFVLKRDHADHRELIKKVLAYEIWNDKNKRSQYSDVIFMTKAKLISAHCLILELKRAGKLTFTDMRNRVSPIVKELFKVGDSDNVKAPVVPDDMLVDQSPPRMEPHALIFDSDLDSQSQSQMQKQQQLSSWTNNATLSSSFRRRSVHDDDMHIDGGEVIVNDYLYPKTHVDDLSQEQNVSQFSSNRSTPILTDIGYLSSSSLMTNEMRVLGDVKEDDLFVRSANIDPNSMTLKEFRNSRTAKDLIDVNFQAYMLLVTLHYKYRIAHNNASDMNFHVQMVPHRVCYVIKKENREKIFRVESPYKVILSGFDFSILHPSSEHTVDTSERCRKTGICSDTAPYAADMYAAFGVRSTQKEVDSIYRSIVPNEDLRSNEPLNRQLCFPRTSAKGNMSDRECSRCAPTQSQVRSAIDVLTDDKGMFAQFCICKLDIRPGERVISIDIGAQLVPETSLPSCNNALFSQWRHPA